MRSLLPTLLRHPLTTASSPSPRVLSLSPSFSLSSAPLLPSLVFFIPSIHVIRIESFNKKFCSPAESAPFCEFKWKSARESGRGWRPGGRRALLACKLKCCHLNANKTPPRAESNVEKEGKVQRKRRKRGKERAAGKFGGRARSQKAGLDRSRDSEMLTRG